MLSKERTQINFSLGSYLYLMKRQTTRSRQVLHQQICKQFYAYRCMHTFSASHSHFVYLKVSLKPSEKLLHTMMLTPYREYLTCPQFLSKCHDASNIFTISKEQQYDLPKCRAFCCFSGYWNTFTTPR